MDHVGLQQTWTSSTFFNSGPDACASAGSCGMEISLVQDTVGFRGFEVEYMGLWLQASPGA